MRVFDECDRVPCLRITNVVVDVVVQALWLAITVYEAYPVASSGPVDVFMALSIMAGIILTRVVAYIVWASCNRDTALLPGLWNWRIFAFVIRATASVVLASEIFGYWILSLAYVGYVIVLVAYIYACQHRSRGVAEASSPEALRISVVPYTDDEHDRPLMRANVRDQDDRVPDVRATSNMHIPTLEHLKTACRLGRNEILSSCFSPDLVKRAVQTQANFMTVVMTALDHGQGETVDLLWDRFGHSFFLGKTDRFVFFRSLLRRVMINPHALRLAMRRPEFRDIVQLTEEVDVHKAIDDLYLAFRKALEVQLWDVALRLSQYICSCELEFFEELRLAREWEVVLAILRDPPDARRFYLQYSFTQMFVRTVMREDQLEVLKELMKMKTRGSSLRFDVDVCNRCAYYVHHLAESDSTVDVWFHDPSVQKRVRRWTNRRRLVLWKLAHVRERVERESGAVD